jgi:Rrf2 family nitric oxide-sensitive transcriptional repressor
MELSRFSDYSLRVLIYAAARDGEKVTWSELAQAYRISHHHLVKIVHFLGRLGFLHNRRGRCGGILLGRKAVDIRVGDVIRKTETHFNLVECFDAASDTCRISPTCRLKGVFQEATQAFLDVLDHYTIEDLVESRSSILRLLSLNGSPPPSLVA